jgi:hypothetical protein
MPPERAIVFLPCHTLDDFPTWLAEAEADDLLSAWTAAWHPWLIAAVGGPPRWASIDLPIPAGPLLGIVPATWDDRFAAQFDASCTTGSCFVRRTTGVEAILQAAAGRLGAPDGPLPGSDQAADFQALGLAILLAELLARRMRSTTDLDSAGVADAVVAAARAAVDGRAADVATALQECFDALSVVRARFYPVDSYVVDLVLLAPTTGRESLARGIDSPVPLAVLASGDTVERLAAQDPAAAAGLRGAVATGRVAACGGRDADRPLDDSLPEELLASFQRGRAAWLATAGVAPTAFGRISGGGSTLLPQLLAGLGYESGLWTLFDGGRLPDVGGGMIRFESAGAAVELLASTPLDARSARTVLGLPEALGEAMDRDHVAALLFAHYAGTASRWHGLIRRIARSTNLLGTFVTPQELVRRTPGTGTLVSLEPDAFPPALPQAGAAAGDDLVGLAVAAAREEAVRAVVAAAPLVAAPSAAAPAPQPVPVPRASRSPAERGWLPRGLFGGGTSAADQLVLDNGCVRLEAHPQTGGLLSLRRPGGGNRLSQQLAVRTTRPPPPAGAGWESPEERASFTRMMAESVARETSAAGRDTLIGRGRLVDADGSVAARFTQWFTLVDGLPLALLDIEVRLERPLAGPLFDSHVAARFAWHENEDVEIRRSLHAQSIATERTRFTAPHFVQIVPHGPRMDADADAVSILTGGLPWHLLSSPHVLDSLLAGGGTLSVVRRMAVGVGLARPWDPALALLAGSPLAAGWHGSSANVRVTVHDVRQAEGRLVAARVGLLESVGRAGEVRIDWGRPVERADVLDFAGEPRPEPTVAIEGTCTVVSLARYQWLHLDLGFAG